jgi:hypothetical protein
MRTLSTAFGALSGLVTQLLGCSVFVLGVLLLTPVHTSVAQAGIRILSQMLTVGIFVVVCSVPLLIFRSSRQIARHVHSAALGLWVLGLWLFCAVYLREDWGWLTYLVGLLTGGFGVVPFAVVCSLLRRDWPTLRSIGMFAAEGVALFGLVGCNLWIEDRRHSKAEEALEGLSDQEARAVLEDLIDEGEVSDRRLKDHRERVKP